MTSLGGAYSASAEGVEGAAVNAAAPSVRDPYSHRWFDWDLSLGFQIAGAFARTDFDNRGEGGGRVGDFLKLDAGLDVQLGYLGLCATSELLSYDLSTQAAGLTMRLGRWRGLASFGALGGQLHLGGGLRAVTLQMVQAGDEGTLLTMTGLAPEVGALLKPDGAQWRLGATLRLGVSGTVFGSDRATVDGEGVRRAGAFILPREVVLPWEVELGVAYQLGPRPLNPPWINPHDQEGSLRAQIAAGRARRAREDEAALASAPREAREALRRRQEREEAIARRIEDDHLDVEGERLYRVRKARYVNWPRERILLLASVLLTGKSDDAVSMQGFLDQQRELVGRALSVAPRLGLESEPIRDTLHLRVGTYVEPSRYETGTARQHFTFGGDVRLFDFNAWGILADTTWRVSLLMDVAPRYTNAGVSIGAWH